MHRAIVWIQSVLVPTLGPLGVFLAAFLDSSFLSLFEVNDILVVTAAAARPERAWIPVTMATLGSVVGCSVVWWLGRRGGEALLVRHFGPERAGRTRAAFERWDLLVLAVPAVLPPPVPFKIFVLAAGVFGFPYRRFTLTVAVARMLRYALWAVLGIVFGERAEEVLHFFRAWFWARLPFLLPLLVLVLLVLVASAFSRRGGGSAPKTDALR